jgi:hypothetical protein
MQYPATYRVTTEKTWDQMLWQCAGWQVLPALDEMIDERSGGMMTYKGMSKHSLKLC